MILKKRAGQLKQDLPIIYLVWKDRDTPVLAKALAAMTAVYALSPIDLIPDFIPVLGLLDDVIPVSYTHLDVYKRQGCRKAVSAASLSAFYRRKQGIELQNCKEGCLSRCRSLP